MLSYWNVYFISGTPGVVHIVRSEPKQECHGAPLRTGSNPLNEGCVVFQMLHGPQGRTLLGKAQFHPRRGMPRNVSTVTNQQEHLGITYLAQ